MKLKKSFKKPLFIIIVVGIFLSLIIIYFLIPNLLALGVSKKTKTSIISQQIQISSSTPIRLKIVKINVNANLESVGLTSYGAMDIPKGMANAAWFNLGPLPGDIGSAVIDGHYGFWKNGSLGVFNNLSKLTIGDELSIDNKNGSTTYFVVRAIKNYRPTDNATNIFLSNDNKAHLNLITCEGAYNKNTKSYS